MSGAPPRVADVVARTLAAHGVRCAFGMPGGEVVTLVDALGAAGIDFVLMRDETAAALAAAGAAAVTGAPGLLVTTLGPGIASAVNGLMDAAQERAPVIAISGAVERGLRARYTHQIVDHAALLRAAVKASFEIETAGAGAAVARALALAVAGIPGPVHLDLAPDTAAAPARDAPAAPPVRARPRPDPADPALAALAARLARAERPLILVGREAAGTGPAVARLAEAIGAPVVTTYKAKGAIPEDHGLSLGAAGLSPRADASLGPVLRAADAVLALGYDPIEMRPGWLDPFGPDAFIAEVSSAPPDHAMHGADLRLTADPADVAAVLAALVVADDCAAETGDGAGAAGAATNAALAGRRAPTPRALGASAAPARWPDRAPAAARAALADAFAPPAPWGPHAAFATLRAATPDDAVVTVDSGAHRILLSQMWTARRPGTLLQSAGWCTMGAALPLAIGAAVAAPSRRVVAVLGDGGLELTLGELGTLRDRGLPVTVVVMQDESLALIELKQAQAGLARAGVALGRTDFPAVARAFGGHGATAADAPSLRAALDAAAARPAFSLIACPIDAADYRGRL
jgi:acetolactate synthase-1/2/3 large subunit